MTRSAATAEALLHRPVCELLQCRYPIVLAGMGGVSRAALVSAVTQAGGFGFLGLVRDPATRICEQVRAVRAATVRPFGVNLIPAATAPELLQEEVEACIALGVPVVCLFWDVFPALIRRLRDAGMLVVHQVGSAQEAHQAQQAGAELLIAQGREAGGHVRGDQPLSQLLPEVLAVCDVPVLAAGGLAEGQDLAAVLRQGAQGAAFGTAFIATHEAYAHSYHKLRLLDAQAQDTLLTRAFHINWPPGADVRVLRNSVTEGRRGDPWQSAPTVIANEDGRAIPLFSTDSPLRCTRGELEAMALYAGEGVGKITSLSGAATLVRRIAYQAAAALQAESGAAESERADSA